MLYKTMYISIILLMTLVRLFVQVEECINGSKVSFLWTLGERFV